jgi:hypothetical protein
LDHHAERRGDRWVLNEQTVRFIPVPRLLLQALGVQAALDGTDLAEGSASFALPLPGDWERYASQIAHEPSAVKEALARLEQEENSGRASPAVCASIRAQLFVRASRALAQMASGQGKLLSVVTVDGRIRWRELLDILPKAECTMVTFSPRVRISGQIPPHIPISRFDRIRTPQPGILLSTEIGFSTQIFCDSPVLMDMIWEQLDGLVHPTWSELVQYLRVPRRLEIAEQTAGDVLRSHGEQSQRLQELRALVAACRLF